MTSEVLRKILVAGGIVAKQAKARAEGFQGRSEGWGGNSLRRIDPG